jgi:isopenicillin-N epimerase
MRAHWTLDPEITFLNHGSFGATPRAVLARQDEYRRQMEREPVRFLVRELEPLLDDVRNEIAGFVGADAAGLAFVPNATAAVNGVLRSLDLDKHDELLVTTQEYNACRNAIDYVSAIEGSRVVVADIPFPARSADDIFTRVMERVTERTRLLLIDHITSQTALIMPVERLAAELNARRIDTLVDGAHAPGMIPLDLRALNAAYYTGNLHKWVCAPKGAAFLYVRANRRADVRPIAISHGANSTRTDRSRFHLEFDWTGTFDPSAWLASAEAIRFMGSLLPGGWVEIMRRNHALALRGRDILASALSIEVPAPDDMLGSMAALPLPDGDADALHDKLLEEFRIEVPIMAWPHPPRRVLRISAHVYNEEREYADLAEALRSAV